MKIAFLVGTIGIGGGNYVVLQHALYAKQQGHDVTIVTMHSGPAEKNWHPAMAQLTIVPLDSLSTEHFDLALATWCGTIFKLDQINARTYAYFVQSIESRFFEESQVRLRGLIDRTYDLGLPGITEATWIQSHIRDNYGMEYYLVKNGIRKDLYTPEGPILKEKKEGKLRVLVEGPFGTKLKNTGKTINICNRLKGLDIWLLTASQVSWYPRVHRVFSQVGIESVPPIYRSCDVIVKLSLVEGMFGPPLEMFHCGGTAIVYNVTGHDEYIAHGKNALVAEMGNEDAVVAYLTQLRDDPALLNKLKTGALETASEWQDWNQSSSQYLQALEAIVAKNLMGREELTGKILALKAEYPTEIEGLTRSPAKPGKATLKSELQKRVRKWKQFMAYVKEGSS